MRSAGINFEIILTIMKVLFQNIYPASGEISRIKELYKNFLLVSYFHVYYCDI
jgi:hypothetical protein